MQDEVQERREELQIKVEENAEKLKDVDEKIAEAETQKAADEARTQNLQEEIAQLKKEEEALKTDLELMRKEKEQFQHDIGTLEYTLQIVQREKREAEEEKKRAIWYAFLLRKLIVSLANCCSYCVPRRKKDNHAEDVNRSSYTMQPLEPLVFGTRKRRSSKLEKHPSGDYLKELWPKFEEVLQPKTGKPKVVQIHGLSSKYKPNKYTHSELKYTALVQSRLQDVFEVERNKLYRKPTTIDFPRPDKSRARTAGASVSQISSGLFDPSQTNFRSTFSASRGLRTAPT